MDKVSGFREEDHPLGRVATAVWDGHVFVNLAEKPLPFSEHLAGLAGSSRPGAWASCAASSAAVYQLKANWKLVIQNYSECLHCPIAHPLLNQQSHYLSGDNEPPQPTYLGGQHGAARGREDALSSTGSTDPRAACRGSPPRTGGASTTTRSFRTCC